jgi:hypothetical protein
LNLIDYQKSLCLLNIFDVDIFEKITQFILRKSFNFTNKLLYVFMVNIFHTGFETTNNKDKLLEVLEYYLQIENLPKRLKFYIMLNLILIDLPLAHLLISKHIDNMLLDKNDEILFYKENNNTVLIKDYLILYHPEKINEINFFEKILKDPKNETNNPMTIESSFYEKFFNYVYLLLSKF